MPYAKVNGLQIHYRDTGEGPGIVMVHGYTGNSRNWALTVPALRDRFRCVSVDLPGHGLSDRPADAAVYTLPAMAETVVVAMRTLGIDSATVMGHSMGGMVAGYVVLEHPEVVNSLILVDTSAEPIRLEGRTRDRARLLEVAREQGMEAAFELTLASGPPTDERFVKVWREQFLMTSLDAYLGCAQGIDGRESLLPRFRGVTTPALIICGEQDAPFVEPSKHMHEAIPGSELAMIPNCGHTPQIETPAEFNRLLLGFLSRVHAGAPA
jgi:pimeloyl-ACP methyl ester carboxylesterase